MTTLALRLLDAIITLAITGAIAVSLDQAGELYQRWKSKRRG